MITFDPLWEQLKKRGITTYQLVENYDFNPVEVYRLKHNHNYPDYQAETAWAQPANHYL